MTQLKVYYQDKLAGYLSEKKSNQNEIYEFIYDQSYLAQPTARPISVNLPLQADKYISKQLFPFFDNLLAEGWLLDAQLKTHKLNSEDRFALIAICGLETIGAVSLKGIDE